MILSKIKGWLSSHSLRRFFISALGEILLIVISILLANQVSERSEKKHEKIEEYSALTRLKQDFQANKNLLNGLINETDSNIQSCTELLRHTGINFNQNARINIDSMMVQITRTSKFYPKNGSLDDLVNSGKLSIIQSSELRSNLSSWPPLLEHLKKRESISTEFNFKTTDYIIANGSWLNVDSKYPPGNLKLPKSGFQVNNMNLLKEIEFENRIDSHILYIFLLNRNQKEVRTLCDEILKLIETELNEEDE